MASIPSKRDLQLCVRSAKNRSEKKKHIFEKHLKKKYGCGKINRQRRNDGIGRRAGLKIQSWQQGAGSTPASGTM